jgi:hypothetical protein
MLISKDEYFRNSVCRYTRNWPGHQFQKALECKRMDEILSVIPHRSKHYKQTYNKDGISPRLNIGHTHKQKKAKTQEQPENDSETYKRIQCIQNRGYQSNVCSKTSSKKATMHISV